jgi:hypothetical protein
VPVRVSVIVSGSVSVCVGVVQSSCPCAWDGGKVNFCYPRPVLLKTGYIKLLSACVGGKHMGFEWCYTLR